MSGLFGSGAGPVTTTTSTPFQEKYLTDIFGRAKTATKVGPDTSGFATGQQEAADAFRGFAGNAGGFLAPAQQAQNFLLTQSLDPATNPNLQGYLDMVNNRLNTQYQNQVVPGLRGGAVEAGNVGGSREGIAQGLAAQGLLQAQGDASSQIAQGAYGQGLNAITQGLSQTPGLVNAGLAAPEALTKASGLQASADQAGYQGELQNLQNYLNLVSGNYGGTTTTTGPGSDTGGLAGLAGLASSAAGIYSAFNPSTALLVNAAGAAGAGGGM